MSPLPSPLQFSSYQLMQADKFKLQLEVLREQAKARYDEIAELNKLHELQRIAVREKAIEFCFAAKLLQNVKWRLLTSYGRTTLTAHPDSKLGYNDLSELFETDYHCSTELDLNSKVRFDDGVLTLQFTDYESLKKFCLEHQLMISKEDFDKSLGDIDRTEFLNQQKKSKIEEVMKDLGDLIQLGNAP